MTYQPRPDTAPAIMDIFLRQAEGSFKWVAASGTLASARQKIVQNPASSDFTFLIVDSTTGEKTIIEPSEKTPENVKD